MLSRLRLVCVSFATRLRLVCVSFASLLRLTSYVFSSLAIFAFIFPCYHYGRHPQSLPIEGRAFSDGCQCTPGGLYRWPGNYHSNWGAIFAQLWRSAATKVAPSRHTRIAGEAQAHRERSTNATQSGHTFSTPSKQSHLFSP